MQRTIFRKKFLSFILMMFLLCDLAYSFRQHLSQPLDGDLPWNVVPADEVKPILNDPFGLTVITQKEFYPNPNRYFSHFTIKIWYEKVPLLLQWFVSPIDSVYLASAIFKILIQALLIFLLAVAISGTFRVFNIDFLIAAILVTPFFQTEGYQSYMGIIDSAPTYVFFYAMPLALLLICFLPLGLIFYHGKSYSYSLWQLLFWVPLGIVVCLSGPLNPGVVLIFSLLFFLISFHKAFLLQPQKHFYNRMGCSVRQVPRVFWRFLLPVSLLSMYSLFLGSFNSNNITIPLPVLYSKLPAGIFNLITTKLGYPVILSTLILNMILVRKSNDQVHGRKILQLCKWFGLFALIYILLLPMGGYRENRPNVIRYDTMMPILTGIVFLVGLSSVFLFKTLPMNRLKWYVLVIAGVLALFTINDQPSFHKADSQKAALRQIAESPSDTIGLPSDCNLIYWGKLSKPEDSKLVSRMLTKWRITDHDKLFYNK